MRTAADTFRCGPRTAPRPASPVVVLRRHRIQPDVCRALPFQKSPLIKAAERVPNFFRARFTAPGPREQAKLNARMRCECGKVRKRGANRANCCDRFDEEPACCAGPLPFVS